MCKSAIGQGIVSQNFSEPSQDELRILKKIELSRAQVNQVFKPSSRAEPSYALQKKTNFRAEQSWARQKKTSFRAEPSRAQVKIKESLYAQRFVVLLINTKLFQQACIMLLRQMGH